MIVFGMNWFMWAFIILFQRYLLLSAFFPSIVALQCQQNIAGNGINLCNLSPTIYGF